MVLLWYGDCPLSAVKIRRWIAEYVPRGDLFPLISENLRSNGGRKRKDQLFQLQPVLAGNAGRQLRPVQTAVARLASYRECDSKLPCYAIKIHDTRVPAFMLIGRRIVACLRG
jgi:hypothetical protein